MGKESITVVFRVEIALLLNSQGGISSEKMDRLVMLISNLQNSGIKTIVVSSGAIVLGSEKLGLASPPTDLPDKQAAAAVGQAELISFYESYFDYYNQVTAQVLITSDIISYPERKENAGNAFRAMLDMGIIPVVNENDPVSTCDIELDDNYPLALIVAGIAGADFIIVKQDTESKYLIVGAGDLPARLVDSEKGLIPDINEMFNLPGRNGSARGGFPASLREIRLQ